MFWKRDASLEQSRVEVIGIDGQSCSGKSSLAHELCARLTPDSVHLPNDRHWFKRPIHPILRVENWDALEVCVASWDRVRLQIMQIPLGLARAKAIDFNAYHNTINVELERLRALPALPSGSPRYVILEGFRLLEWSHGRDGDKCCSHVHCTRGDSYSWSVNQSVLFGLSSELRERLGIPETRRIMLSVSLAPSLHATPHSHPNAGHHLSCSDAIRELCDKVVVLAIGEETCFRRRMSTKPVPLEYFDAILWPEALIHARYVLKLIDEALAAPTASSPISPSLFRDRDALLVLDGEDDFARNLQLSITFITGTPLPREFVPPLPCEADAHAAQAAAALPSGRGDGKVRSTDCRSRGSSSTASSTVSRNSVVASLYGSAASVRAACAAQNVRGYARLAEIVAAGKRAGPHEDEATLCPWRLTDEDRVQ